MLVAIFYLGSIVVANLLVMQFGIVQAAGISFPAGAVAIGFTFTARDLVQRRFCITGVGFQIRLSGKCIVVSLATYHVQ